MTAPASSAAKIQINAVVRLSPWQFSRLYPDEAASLDGLGSEAASSKPRAVLCQERLSSTVAGLRSKKISTVHYCPHGQSIGRQIAVLRGFALASWEPFSGDADAGSRFCAAIIPYLREPMRPRLGVRPWGDIIMTDSEWWKERRNRVARYRVMEQETTDPLAARLLHDIVMDLEAELEGLRQSIDLDAA